MIVHNKIPLPCISAARAAKGGEKCWYHAFGWRSHDELIISKIRLFVNFPPFSAFLSLFLSFPYLLCKKPRKRVDKIFLFCYTIMADNSFPWPVGQAAKTPPSHGGNGSSILPRVTKAIRHSSGGFFDGGESNSTVQLLPRVTKAIRYSSGGFHWWKKIVCDRINTLMDFTITIHFIFLSHFSILLS